MNFSKNINTQLKINVIKDKNSLISHNYLTILNLFSHKINIFMAIFAYNRKYIL